MRGGVAGLSVRRLTLRRAAPATPQHEQGHQQYHNGYDRGGYLL